MDGRDASLSECHNVSVLITTVRSKVRLLSDCGLAAVEYSGRGTIGWVDRAGVSVCIKEL